MDPLSVIASSLTLFGAVSTTGHLAWSLKSSPEDLQQLEQQLDYLQIIADAVSAHVQGRSSADISIILYPVERLKNARKLLVDRFKRRQNVLAGKSDFRPSMRYHDIKKLKREVLSIRHDLSTAVVLLSMTLADSVVDSYRLELSPKFSPEHCATPGSLMEPLLVYSTIELHRTKSVQVHQYFLLLAQDQRRWRRIIATITTGTKHDFICQGSFHQGSEDLGLGALHVLFRQALTNLQNQLFDYGTNISMELSFDHGRAPRIVTDSTTFTEIPNRTPTNRTACILAEISSRGLAVFSESDVVVVENLIQSWYLVRIGSQHYLERMAPFRSTLEDVTTFEYWGKLQPLLRLQGSPFIVKFGGVIMDDSRTHIRGHAIKLPERGVLRHVLFAANEAGLSVSWSSKEKWIRQLMTAVAEAHRRGVVLGDLAFSQLWLDRNDDLVIVDMKRWSDELQQRPGNTPPEFRSKSPQKKSDAVPGHELNFATDVFGLGLAIWSICEQRQGDADYRFCKRYPCTSLYRYRCTAPHSNPVELPPIKLGLRVPAYIDTIVQLCRQRDPTRRPSASTLLDMLSTSGVPAASLDRQVVPVSFSAIEEVKYRIYCDECGTNCTFELYSCRICDQGDFDLCPNCHEQGVKCWDPTHRLHRRRRKDGQWAFDEAM